MTGNQATSCRRAGLTMVAALAGLAPWQGSGHSAGVNVRLSEWKVELSERRIPAGPVTFKLENTGSVPHQLEVEGEGIEQSTELIQPGASATLSLDLKPGRYEVYCPIGNGSHKHLGMEAGLEVTGQRVEMQHQMSHEAMMPHDSGGSGAGAGQGISVTGGGPVVQILPGSFPFPDSAGPILKAFGGEQETLESQAENGPYSNNVAAAKGTFAFRAWDLGAVKDSVSGTALVTTREGVRWKVVLDRVQTKDVPHHPKFGGVIMGLYYHGATQVHTPLVPTINSAVALWSVAHLYRNDVLVSDNALVHVMLLSRTRHPGDWKLECWDCSNNPIEELQLQVTQGPGEPPIDAPGGFLFVNWEKSVSARL